MPDGKQIEDQLVDALMHATIRFSRLQMRSWKLFSRAQYIGVHVIMKESGGKNDGVPVSAIAEHMRVSPPAVSRLLKDLEKHGAIVREPDPTDRRATLVRLTDKGMELHDQAHALINEYLSITIADFGQERTERFLNDMEAFNEKTVESFEKMKELHPELADDAQAPFPFNHDGMCRGRHHHSTGKE